MTTVNLGGMNCCLARCADGFVLIDTGFSVKRALLLQMLHEAGCKPGDIRFVLITHGDVESFFSSLKRELVHGERYRTRDEAKLSLFEYVEVFYHRIRKHSGLGYTSPEQ